MIVNAIISVLLSISVKIIFVSPIIDEKGIKIAKTIDEFNS